MKFPEPTIHEFIQRPDLWFWDNDAELDTLNGIGSGEKLNLGAGFLNKDNHTQAA